METRAEGDLLFVKMAPGEEIVEALIDACRMHDINTAVVLSSIGQLEKFKLGYFVEKGDYSPTYFEKPHELVSISGMINRIEESYIPHLHASLGSLDKNLVGGHLIEGAVKITNETVLRIILKWISTCVFI